MKNHKFLFDNAILDSVDEFTFNSDGVYLHKVENWNILWVGDFKA